MKKVILSIAIGVSLMSAAIVKQNNTFDCQYGQCSKIKSDGYRCRNCAQEGSAYCWSHSH